MKRLLCCFFAAALLSLCCCKAELTALYFAEEELTAVTGICFDETQELDLSGVPTLTLLRACADTDLWPLARENCSTACKAAARSSRICFA